MGVEAVLAVLPSLATNQLLLIFVERRYESNPLFKFREYFWSHSLSLFVRQTVDEKIVRRRNVCFKPATEMKCCGQECEWWKTVLVSQQWTTIHRIRRYQRPPVS